MEIEKTHIDYIKTAFKDMQTKEDLLSLMNYVKPFIYGDKSVPFDLKQLTYYAYPHKDKPRYSEFQIKKKSGGVRSIHAPVKGLKAIQRTLAFILESVFEAHPAAKGFVKEKSIVDNAKVHTGNYYVYNIDLKDFFQSIDQARVTKCLQLSPFNLNDSGNLIKPNAFIWAFLKKVYKTESGDFIGYNSLGERFVSKEIELAENSYVIALKATVGNYFNVQNMFFNREDTIKEYDKKFKSYNELLKILKKSNNLEVAFLHTVEKNERGVFLGYGSDKMFVSKIFELTKDAYVIGKKIANSDYYSVKDMFFNIEDAIREFNKLKNSDTSRLNIANIISNICCANMKVERKNEHGNWRQVSRNVLPQGAPTSPILTNVVCQRLDFLLSAVAKRFGLKYSRYADDITFSSLHNVFQKDSVFLNEMERVIIDQGFTIKPSKTRLQVDGMQKVVTGLVVNEKVNVKKRYVKQIRMWLYYWEKYGREKAEQIFKRDYVADKRHVKNTNVRLVNVLDGKLEFLKMVKGAEDSTYKKLKERFDKLAGHFDPINQLLEIWENEGVEKAMEVYYKKDQSESIEVKKEVFSHLSISDLFDSIL